MGKKSISDLFEYLDKQKKTEKFYVRSSNMMLLLLLNRGSLRTYPLIALTFILIIIPFIAKIVSMLTREVAAWACLSQTIYYVCSVQI